MAENYWYQGIPFVLVGIAIGVLFVNIITFGFEDQSNEQPLFIGVDHIEQCAHLGPSRDLHSCQIQVLDQKLEKILDELGGAN